MISQCRKTSRLSQTFPDFPRPFREVAYDYLKNSVIAEALAA